MKRQLSGISQEKFTRIAAEIQRRLGFQLPDNNGTIESHGFRVQIQHDPDAQTLRLELLKKPWYVPDSTIAKKIDEWLSEAGG